METIPSYFKYWGKAKKDSSQDGADYHLLPYHCLDVAAVGELLFSSEKQVTKDLAEFLELQPEQLQRLFTFCLCLHDLGKFASAFQKLYSAPNSDLLIPECCKEYDGREYRHDRMGLFFWQDLVREKLPELLGLSSCDNRDKERCFDSLMVIMNSVLGHHGQPINTNSPRSIKAYTEPHNLAAARDFVVDIVALFQPMVSLEHFKSAEWRRRLEQVSWQLAGIAVLADWVGSANDYFEYHAVPMSLESYWSHAQKTAKDALASTDLDRAPFVRPFQSIEAHYGFPPTPLQKWAASVEVDSTPQLFILEDVTGAGKTEAALALTHRLMEAGAADGFYFGLPTMATSNAMFSRIASHYHQMLDAQEKQPSIVLAHGAREMNELFREAVLSSKATDKPYSSNDETATVQCNHWLADSRKKALLAPIGVGTLDQALLAVLPRRHQSLRLLGLNRKVLIFDEVHAADEYMFELLESLLSLHLHQGGSVILLTATLSQKQREKLTAIWLKSAGLPATSLKNTHFPLATKVSISASESVQEIPLKSREDVSRTVAVDFIKSADACIELILDAVALGQCVVWIRNTVNDAIEAYQRVMALLDKPENCLLFHSRFVLQDRKNTEDRVLEYFGKQSDGDVRKGKVLIATQVFQESLDADADVMISDICPIDDLIQRAGRLHRHTRDDTGAYQRTITDARPSPVLYIHAPTWSENPASDWLSKDFLTTQYVYRSPGRLWLGMRELKTLGRIQMPTDARQLIESVYSDAAYDQIPEMLKHQENELIGGERSKAAKAKSQLLRWQEYGYCDRSSDHWYEDNSDISTRYSDIETVEVLLLRVTEEGHLTSWVEDPNFAIQLSTVKLSKNKYADKLASIPPHLEGLLEGLERRYKPVSFLKCWVPEYDKNYAYDSVLGFSEQKEVL
ncbi:CRISPR-associated helicase Cas3' [Neptunomonas phycophila]|uniref:CRISPR-associated helicase Cas3' n=1 Tax=Neptunomonas phycophila TaxID=1572645 RepID=UPI0030F8DEB9